MAQTLFTDLVTLILSSWLNEVDAATYNFLTGVAGTNTITGTGPTTTTAYAANQRFVFTPANTNTSATTLNVSGIGAKNIFLNGVALTGGELRQNVPALVMYDGTRFHLLSTAAVPVNFPQCDFRLTLTSGTPVTTSDVTGAGTIYAAPYRGNRIALYDGAAWNVRASGEFSLALVLTSGKPYDIFCFDNAGVPTLEALVWTNDTTRATALTTQDGVLVKTGATTRRYLGTIYASGANTTEDSIAKRYVWNYYNQRPRPMRAVDTTDSWTYTLAAYRQANGAAANQLDYVQGVSETPINAVVIGAAGNSSGNVQAGVGIGVDSTTVNSAAIISPNSIIATRGFVMAAYSGYPGVGRHTLVWLEISDAAGTTTWMGDNGSGTRAQTGVSGELLG